jgi:hypothetical protein
MKPDGCASGHLIDYLGILMAFIILQSRATVPFHLGGYTCSDYWKLILICCTIKGLYNANLIKRIGTISPFLEMCLKPLGLIQYDKQIRHTQRVGQNNLKKFLSSFNVINEPCGMELLYSSLDCLLCG